MATKILMVCLGNICRSPLAQGILEKKVFKSVIIDSAGTAGYHIGKSPDQRSIDIGNKNGVDISNYKARQFSKEDFKNFDHIYVMDNSNYKDVQILSYAVKYASSFYGPFRDAVGSKKSLKGDKKTYQMDFRNSDEALREIALDVKEGADMVMVKPGMPYLDIIKSIKEKFKIPVFAYQVSGEYSLISNAIQKKLVNEDAVFESLVAFKRAGANAIVSYYADRIDKIIK